MKIELIKAEVKLDDQGGETTALWFEATVDGETFGDQMILCDPSSYTKSMWQGIGKHISDTWETWAKANNIKW
jgi:hypothetical protein